MNIIKIMRYKKSQKGFTLVELLVVIAIISILTIITVSQFGMSRIRARDAQRKADLNALAKSLQMYFADYGKFPAESVINGNWGGEFKDDKGYVYMKVLPKETLTKPYCYVSFPGSPNKFGLFAMLENEHDVDCKTNYQYCGNTDPGYCYYIVSPNAAPDTLNE